MKLFFTVTKKGLCIAISVITVLFLTAVWSASLKLSVVDGSTHAKRMTFIKGLGIEVDEGKCTSKDTVIPMEFGLVYEEYNKLQKQAGFNLADFKGKEVTVYSYPLLNGDKILTLLVHNNEIIGGDVAEIKLNGEMLPLRK